MDEAQIEHELRESQTEVTRIGAIRERRQRAVLTALDHGWTKYKIAGVLGVRGPTVDSIITAAKRVGR